MNRSSITIWCGWYGNRYYEGPVKTIEEARAVDWIPNVVIMETCQKEKCSEHITKFKKPIPNNNHQFQFHNLNYNRTGSSLNAWSTSIFQRPKCANITKQFKGFVSVHPQNRYVSECVLHWSNGPSYIPLVFIIRRISVQLSSHMGISRHCIETNTVHCTHWIPISSCTLVYVHNLHSRVVITPKLTV